MKKVLALLAALLIVCTGINSVYADTDCGVDWLIKEEKEKVKTVRDQLDKVLKAELAMKGPTWKKADGEKVEGFGQLAKYDIDKAYKIQPIWSMNAAKESGSVKDSIEKYEFYDVPAVTADGMNALVTIMDDGGELRFHSMSYGGDTKDLIVDFEKVKKGIEESSLVNEKLISMQLLDFAAFETEFVFFNTQDEEYLMPFYSTGQFGEKKLEKYKVYPASELVEMFTEYYDEENGSEKKRLYGGIALPNKNLKQEETSNYLLWIGIPTAMVIVILLVSLYYNKRKIQMRK
ncbi:MAG: hypothetical protein IK138_00395 [Lachnospiraceae bacterium]|nr:hypothetical protein [Lachnospiraceae bacterium]